MIFLEGSRYNRYESNTSSNKRKISARRYCCRQTNKKRKGELLSLCQAAKKRVSVLRETRGNGHFCQSRDLKYYNCSFVFIKEDCCIFYDSHLYRIHSPRIGK